MGGFRHNCILHNGKTWIRRSDPAQYFVRLRLYVWLELQVDIQGFVRIFLKSALYKTFLSSLSFVPDINTSLILEIFTWWFSPLRTGLRLSYLKVLSKNYNQCSQETCVNFKTSSNLTIYFSSLCSWVESYNLEK